MDPQQRMLLEVAWEALEHAGIAPVSLRGHRTGVFVGIATHDYGHLTDDRRRARPVDGDRRRGQHRRQPAVLRLDLRGPSMAVDTACSSSLVAVHHACAACGPARADLALAGGVNLMLLPGPTAAFAAAGLLAAATAAARPSRPAPTASCAARAAVSWCSSGWRTPSATATGCSPSSAASAVNSGRPLQRPDRAQPASPSRRCCATPTAAPGSIRPLSTTSRRTAPARCSATRSRPARSARSSARESSRRPAAADRLGEDEHRPPRSRGRDRRADQGRAGADARRAPAAAALHRAEPAHPVRRAAAAGRHRADTVAPPLGPRHGRCVRLRVRRHQRARRRRAGRASGRGAGGHRRPDRAAVGPHPRPARRAGHAAGGLAGLPGRGFARRRHAHAVPA